MVHDSTYTKVTTAKEQQQQQQQLAAAGQTRKEPAYVAVHVTCGFGRATRRVYVLVVFVS